MKLKTMGSLSTSALFGFLLSLCIGTSQTVNIGIQVNDDSAVISCTTPSLHPNTCREVDLMQISRVNPNKTKTMLARIDKIMESVQFGYYAKKTSQANGLIDKVDPSHCNLTLTLVNPTVEDEGKYVCEVYYVDTWGGLQRTESTLTLRKLNKIYNKGQIVHQNNKVIDTHHKLNQNNKDGNILVQVTQTGGSAKMNQNKGKIVHQNNKVTVDTHHKLNQNNKDGNSQVRVTQVGGSANMNQNKGKIVQNNKVIGLVVARKKLNQNNKDGNSQVQVTQTGGSANMKQNKGQNVQNSKITVITHNKLNKNNKDGNSQVQVTQIGGSDNTKQNKGQIVQNNKVIDAHHKLNQNNKDGNSQVQVTQTGGSTNIKQNKGQTVQNSKITVITHNKLNQNNKDGNSQVQVTQVGGSANIKQNKGQTVQNNKVIDAHNKLNQNNKDGNNQVQVTQAGGSVNIKHLQEQIDDLVNSRDTMKKTLEQLFDEYRYQIDKVARMGFVTENKLKKKLQDLQSSCDDARNKELEKLTSLLGVKRTTLQEARGKTEKIFDHRGATKQILKKMIADAKMAAFASSIDGKTFPAKVGKAIVFDNVALNEGKGYNGSTGVFTAPRSGIYAFHLTLICKSANDCIHVALQMNKRDLVELSRMKTVSEVVQLHAGDKVSVVVKPTSTPPNVGRMAHLKSSVFCGYFLQPV